MTARTVAPPGEAPPRERVRLRIGGVVQGVGFRPFVYRAGACSRGLAGFVANSPAGVTIEAEGSPAAVAGFDATGDRCAARPCPDRGRPRGDARADAAPAAFEIRASALEGERTARVLPDLATCDDCLARDCSTRATGAIATPSPTARSAARATRSSRTCRTTARARRCARFAMCAACRRRVRGPRRPPLPRRAECLPGVRSAAGAVGRGRRGARRARRRAARGGRRRSATARSSRSRASAASTSWSTRGTKPRSRRLRAAQAPRGEAVRGDVRRRSRDAARPTCAVGDGERALLDLARSGRSSSSRRAGSARSPRPSRRGNPWLGAMLAVHAAPPPPARRPRLPAGRDQRQPRGRADRDRRARGARRGSPASPTSSSSTTGRSCAPVDDSVARIVAGRPDAPPPRPRLRPGAGRRRAGDARGILALGGHLKSAARR